MRSQWFVALVRGPSMAPTLRSGDAVLVRRTRHARPGDVVVARFTKKPDLLVIKRAIRPVRGGWWLEGDNRYGSDDSGVFGPAEIQGKVVLRYWPRPRFVRRPDKTLGATS